MKCSFAGQRILLANKGFRLGVSRGILINIYVFNLIVSACSDYNPLPDSETSKERFFSRHSGQFRMLEARNIGVRMVHLSPNVRKRVTVDYSWIEETHLMVVSGFLKKISLRTS
jgi:hypothetical protein